MVRKVFGAFAVAAALCGGAEASPAVEFRGVVEGYYGRPWGTEGRLSLLEFMGENDMNVFIYGPKDDPYHHAKWREPYPEKEMLDFRRILECAKENNIHCYWAIHLGDAFRNPSNAEDYAALFRKLNWMYDDGFRAFAVFFDDFGGQNAELHAEICNNVVKEFLEKKGDCAPLIMCPNVYWGSGHKYQKTLGEKLDDRVHIMWTGSTICSDIRARDVERITGDFRRPPFIWWNWPVNDYCRSSLLLGRTYGIDDCKYAGFVSNPMENCEANKIALYSIAKWCKNPAEFDSQKAWEESFPKIYKDPEVAKAMQIFAAHNSDHGSNGHGYRKEESVRAKPLIDKAAKDLAETGALSAGTIGALVEIFAELDVASKTLLEKLPLDKGLGWEMEGWLKRERCMMAAAIRTLETPFDADGAAMKELACDLAKIRDEGAKFADEHKAKFAAATFANDRGYVRAPVPSVGVLRPFIDGMIEKRLRAAYAKKTGRSVDAAGGFAAFSTADALRNLNVSRDGIAVAIERVMEQREVKSGETFGLSVPEGCRAENFVARVGSAEAADAGVIEGSKDGAAWTELQTRRNGGEMRAHVGPHDGWRFFRYRNASGKTVKVKINEFKVDAKGVDSVVDTLIKELTRD